MKHPAEQEWNEFGHDGDRADAVRQARKFLQTVSLVSML
jgi:hypothetical protein